MTVDAGYFDGKTSRRQSVRLQAGLAGVDLIGDGWRRHEPREGIRVSEPLGAAPRTLTFADGSHCEVAQGEGLNELLAVIDHREGTVARWQGSWRVALAALAAVLLLLLAGYRWGLPWAATQAAARVPPEAVTAISGNVLAVLDKQALAPSQLSLQRQYELDKAFQRLSASDPPAATPQLLFRHAGKLGPNAFALPDGRVVLFDELVELADDDAQVLAVLSHELGHVKYRHGLRQLIQSSVVSLVVAGYFGDFSSLLSGLSTLLLESRYSRAFELEADAYGATLLRRNGYSPDDLAIMLEKLEKAHEKGRSGGEKGADWLSSHPDTAERIKRLGGD